MCSVPVESYCMRTLATKCVDAKMYKMKSLSKLGGLIKGAKVRACLRTSKDYLAYSSQTNGMVDRRSLSKPWAVVAYSGTNRWRKLTFPWRLCNWRRVHGGGSSRMAWTLSRSRVIPCSDIMNPKRCLVGTQKTQFGGLRWILYLWHRKNTVLKSWRCYDQSLEWAVRSSSYARIIWAKSWNR